MKAAKGRIRCAIYTRKSSEEGLDQAFNSLDAQREACAAYILSQIGEGWSALPEVYDDGGYSGGSMERPALQRLLGEVRAGRVDVVVVYKVDRLTRSLGDFARIIEVFDAAGASFVSVTQAFNTTTSMGRLTLNVLLSFAQFEREVTGERIRDKIAASKAKGMWMGGVPPLGYAIQARELVVVPAEAEQVRRIYQRYLDLGSVARLRDELAAQGYRSKTWVSASGRAHGGVPVGRGPLYHLLSNRLYLGEIGHKGAHHPGRHAAIIDPATFEAVQSRLAERGGPKRRTRANLPERAPSAPLAGLIFDAAGCRMSPVVARKPDGRRYRYYVSSHRQKGQGRRPAVLERAPAEVMEHLILERAQALELNGAEPPPWALVRAALRRVEVAARQIRIVFSAEAVDVNSDLERARSRLPAKDTLTANGDRVELTVRVSLARRGLGKMLAGPDGAPLRAAAKLDPALSKALAQAESWKRRFLRGEVTTFVELSRQVGLQAARCERILQLAFLAPDLKRAILDGRTPSGLVLQRLRTDGIPDLWEDQRRQISSYAGR